MIDTVTGPTFSTLKVDSQASFGDDSSGVTIFQGKVNTKSGVYQAGYGASGVTWIYGQDSGKIDLPRKRGTQTFALLSDLTGKQDKLTQGRNIEITGTTIQTAKELDASKISNSSGGLTVGNGSSTVNVSASGISLSAISYVNINANTATIDAQGGVSVTGDVAMADSLSVSGAITTASNNPASTTLKEVVVDTDYVIIDGGDSTTTW